MKITASSNILPVFWKKILYVDANNYSEQYGVYERVRSAQVLADLKERNSLSKAAWDDLIQDIPYQKGAKFYFIFL